MTFLRNTYLVAVTACHRCHPRSVRRLAAVTRPRRGDHMTAYVEPTNFNPLKIRRRLGREIWAAPTAFGSDGWSFMNLDGTGSIIISCAPHDGEEWVHASIARKTRMPNYADLQLLHHAVFNDGWAYQVFAPLDEHVNIHEYALHLWGRLDGKPVLPDFTAGMGSI